MKDQATASRWMIALAWTASVLLAAAGLWIALAWAEPVYRFLEELREEFTEGQWRQVVAARLLAWLILAFSVGQLVAVALSVFWLRGRRMVMGLFAGALLLLAMIVVWSYLMMPSVALLQAVRA